MKKINVRLQETLQFLNKKIKNHPKIGLILGSGLGELADEMEKKVLISYKEIPYFPLSTVAGHASNIVIGRLMGKDVIAMQGRFHFYEGYSMTEVTYPIWVMKELGVEKIIVTNAAGGINKSFSPGDLMIIEDHINLMGTNPLIGPNNDKFGERFPDMTEAYNRELIKIAEQVASQSNLEIQKGVYAGLTGPNYETPAEVRYLRTIGADAAGMSTVPEVIVANYLGLSVLGISCITNMAAGVTDKPLSHQEVMETGNQVKEKFSHLIKGIIKEV